MAQPPARQLICDELRRIARMVEIDSDYVEHDITESKTDVFAHWSDFMNKIGAGRTPFGGELDSAEIRELYEFHRTLHAADPWANVTKHANEMITLLEQKKNA